MKHLTNKYIYIIFFITMLAYSQNPTTYILWDKINNEPIQHATIKTNESYSISNENGVFEVNETQGKIFIQNIAYKKMEIDYEFLKEKDTIFMSPNIYKLDEVTLLNIENKYNKMLRTLLTDYALEPHQEKFYLRAVVRKNGGLYKIVDFSGFIEKKALFSTRSKPMPKKNYSIQLENIRKVGKENRTVDFEMLSFEYFFNHIVSIYLSPKIYDLSYEETEDNDLSKIILTPKDTIQTFSRGQYILNDDNTFNEVKIEFNNQNASFQNVGNVKFRTVYLYTKTNFERNPLNEKIQLNKALHKARTEVYDEKDNKDIFEVNYIFYANPIKNKDLKNNVKLKKDIFELKGTYNEDYWKKNDILPLTIEMQEFINQINSSGKNSDFKTKTNIKE